METVRARLVVYHHNTVELIPHYRAQCLVRPVEGEGAIEQVYANLMKALKQAGLVAERPEGRKVYYRAQPEGLGPLVDWMSHYGVFWRERFANLRTLLKEIDP